MRAAGPHSEDMDPELRTVMLGGREEEAAPASGMFRVKQPHLFARPHQCCCLFRPRPLLVPQPLSAAAAQT